MKASQLLDMLRDARELQDKEFEQSVLEQLEVDVAYVEKGAVACASTYRPRFDDDSELLDYGDEPETEAERRERVGRTARNIEQRDWLTWMKSKGWWRHHATTTKGMATSTTSTLSAIYKAHYSSDAIAIITNRPHPLWSTLKKSGSLK